MKITHHIGDEMLEAYVTGELSEGWSLAVATHLALCPACRRRSQALEAVGGALLEQAETAAVADDSFDRVMSRVMDGDVAVKARPAAAVATAAPVLPEPLRSYLGGDVDEIPWRSLGRKARQIIVKTGDDGTSVRLLRIPAGEPVPEHGHRGMELTVVLSGALVDGSERFMRGDVEQADESVEHQPRAGEGEDCICLAVTDAPLRFKSFIVRLAQPFLKI